MLTKLKIILVVEDHKGLREELISLLEEDGYEVFGARNGGEALALLRTEFRPALILLDLMMPEMDGVEFCAQKSRDPKLAAIPVVIVTARHPMTVPEGVSPDDCFQKPFDIPKLLATIEKYASAPKEASQPGTALARN